MNPSESSWEQVCRAGPQDPPVAKRHAEGTAPPIAMRPVAMRPAPLAHIWQALWQWASFSSCGAVPLPEAGSWPGTPPPISPEHYSSPHLANRKVPYSNGLQFTGCQLCWISSTSASSMLSLALGAQI
jgi:hypothetical protein